MILSRYFYTLRDLKWRQQIVGRIWFRLYRPTAQAVDYSLRPPVGEWQAFGWRKPLLVAANQVKIFQQSIAINQLSDWNSSTKSKLYLYNLHYFDDLNTQDSNADWQRALLLRWVQDNPPVAGNGWEPYPLSLRIVNIIKWALRGNALCKVLQDSLALQANYLSQRLEYHLLGNHLWANAKALVFAGCFFSGAAAQQWLQLGLKILRRELIEQTLTDGAHFELSPMYHSIFTEDLLDLANLSRVYPQQLTLDCRAALWQALGWLQQMTHPDGEFAFFNDTAGGIAANHQQLMAYARQLGIEVNPSQTNTSTNQTNPSQTNISQTNISQTNISVLGASGYRRLQNKRAVLIADTAAIGPTYLPGHAHADTLSFELSVDGQRVLVNSGTSDYGDANRRAWQRSTAAHNTVVIDEQNSSEVWASFRVARRAHIKLIHATDSTLSAEHDGYTRLPGKPIHQRSWVLNDNQLIIADQLRGAYNQAEAFFYFHPDVKVELLNAQAGRVVLPSGVTLQWQITDGHGELNASVYYPTFAMIDSKCSQCLKVKLLARQASISWQWTDVA